MGVHFAWTGLEELKAALRTLPSDLAGEAGHLVEGRANGAAATIKAGYPRRAGTLQDGLTVTHYRSAFGARSVVKNTDRDAAVFERGSQARHTKLGANRGPMPANPIFSRTMRRERRALWDVDIRDLLERQGLVVTGDV